MYLRRNRCPVENLQSQDKGLMIVNKFFFVPLPFQYYFWVILLVV